MIDQTLPDIPRVVTGLAEAGACLVYLLILRRRMAPLAFAAIAVVGTLALIATQAAADLLPLPLWTLGMLAAVLAMYTFLRVCLDSTRLATVYLTARAFVLAELVASLHWQLHTFFLPHGAITGPAIVLLIVTFTGCFVLAWFAEARHLPRGGEVDAGWRETVAAVAIASATFGISNLSFTGANTPFSGRIGHEIFYIRTLVDLCGYIALYAQQEWRREVRARAESQAMQSLLRSQHDQYRTTKRAIDEVSRKHHDMKHVVQAIRAEEDPTIRARLVDELEQSIADYGTRFRTGNAVLDTVLQAKAMTARDEGIEITCVADGALLDMLTPLDLVTVTGNALDNAIEAATRTENDGTRSVRVALFAQDAFVMLRIDNTYDGVLLREGDMPRSRKPDADDHGFGLRSIEQTVATYGGSMSINADERWFSLRLLFPRPQKSGDSASR
ncbi:sensor histidine kinase [Microbacterium amylolyticum]|uniref:Two-component sensor histidine kinase n=1 Tax=Microbacterium amylolyticum TaxID=936337 RepID=A0ABS4ZDR1_9MICO|nr:sensor histidine kinase [Microbacterium amylolyticum]MBP2435427.1 two-component sensor histidine kinase [Microbacterium amylolyticum]